MSTLKAFITILLVVGAVNARPHHDGEHDHHPGAPYGFGYSVKDDYYGTDYSHVANSNGDAVKGEYRTLLPDGRVQIVRYTADWKNGYNAQVIYENAGLPAPAPAPYRPQALALQFPPGQYGPSQVHSW